MTLTLGALIVLLATFLGGVVGFAYGLTSFPLLLLIGVPLQHAVAVNLFIALCTRIFILARRYRDVNWRRVTALVGGSLPGILVGSYILRVVDTRTLQVAAGILILVAVVTLVLRQRSTAPGATGRRERRTVEVGAGAMGGFLGVTTSLNGIPPALLLTGSRVGARSMVADLAVYFIASNAVSLVALSIGGRVATIDVVQLASVWVPIGVVGTYVGLVLGPRLPQQLFRNLALSLIALAGILCIGTAG